MSAIADTTSISGRGRRERGLARARIEIAEALAAPRQEAEALAHAFLGVLEAQVHETRRAAATAAEKKAREGRGELAANEHAEGRIIDEYLPTPLTDAEVADVADTAIAQVAEEIGGRPGMKQMGMVMKAATAIAAGKADGARLSAAVKERL